LGFGRVGCFLGGFGGLEVLFRAIFGCSFEVLFGGVFRCSFEVLFTSLFRCSFKVLFGGLFRCSFEVFFGGLFRCAFEVLCRCWFKVLFKCWFKLLLEGLDRRRGERTGKRGDVVEGLMTPGVSYGHEIKVSRSAYIGKLPPRSDQLAQVGYQVVPASLLPDARRPVVLAGAD
jgi:hypothetical protein